MDSEDKKKIDDILKLSIENNEYIKKVRNSQRNSQIFKAVYWTFILVVTFGGLVFIQPYVGNMINLYNGGIGALKSVQELQGTASIIKR